MDDSLPFPNPRLVNWVSNAPARVKGTGCGALEAIARAKTTQANQPSRFRCVTSLYNWTSTKDISIKHDVVVLF